MPDGLAALRSLGMILDAPARTRSAAFDSSDRGVSVEAAFPEGYALGMRRTVSTFQDGGSSAPQPACACCGARPCSGIGAGRRAKSRANPSPPAGSSARMAFTLACGVGPGSPPATREPALRLPHPLSRRALERLHGIALGRGLPDLRNAYRPARGLRRADLAQSTSAHGRSLGAVSATCRAPRGRAARHRRTRRRYRELAACRASIAAMSR